jgi:hypothetical protein
MGGGGDCSEIAGKGVIVDKCHVRVLFGKSWYIWHSGTMHVYTFNQSCWPGGDFETLYLGFMTSIPFLKV